jgi:hypothetical protein
MSNEINFHCYYYCYSKIIAIAIAINGKVFKYFVAAIIILVKLYFKLVKVMAIKNSLINFKIFHPNLFIIKYFVLWNYFIGSENKVNCPFLKTTVIIFD